MSFRLVFSRLLLLGAASFGVVSLALAQEEATPVDLKLPKLETKSDPPATPDAAATPAKPDAPAKSTDPELAELEEQADPATLKAIDLYIEGDVDGAYALFKQVYDANPDSDPPGVLIATLHSHAGRLLDMRRALEKTAEDYPTDPESFLQLAGIDAQEGRFLLPEHRACYLL